MNSLLALIIGMCGSVTTAIFVLVPLLWDTPYLGIACFVQGILWGVFSSLISE